MDINGSTEGLKNSVIEALESIYNLEVPQEKLWTEELINTISSISGETNREIAVYIDRKGRIIDVIVGDFRTVDLTEVEGRRSKTRLTGVRCIHTHRCKWHSFASRYKLFKTFKAGHDCCSWLE